MMLAIAMIYDDINKDISLDKNWPHIRHEVALWESAKSQKGKKSSFKSLPLCKWVAAWQNLKCRERRSQTSEALACQTIAMNIAVCSPVDFLPFCVCIAFVCNVFAYAFAFQLNVFAFAFVCNVFAFALLLYLNLLTLLQLTSNKSGFNSCGLENLTMCTTLQFNSFELIWGLLIW